MSKHTPGPWQYSTLGKQAAVIAKNSSRYEISLRYAPIAAHGDSSAFTQARAAIAKAKGE